MDVTFRLLEQITNHFSADLKIGSGSNGEVYKGVHEGKVIAVKKLFSMHGIDDTEFTNEFRNLMKVEHPNIIRLIAYCHEVRKKHLEIKGEYFFSNIIERLLCFEYMEGGSLAKHITDESCGFDWMTRYKIIKGICEGLNHLHNGRSYPIYHLDLKPDNILLDMNMMPRIADFGMSRLLASSKTHITQSQKGTTGYMPPEFIQERRITKKYDVFSFGVIIIQIMTGAEGYNNYCEMSSPHQFIEFVHENWKKRLQAMPMQENTSHKAVRKCIELAVRCVHADPAKRPSIIEVISELNELDADMAQTQHMIQEGINSMKIAQGPMVNYLTGSMNSLFDKLTKTKNRANFEALHEELMTLNKDFVDKLVGNGRLVVNLQVKVWMKQVRELVFDIEDWIYGMTETIMGDPTARDKIEEFRTLIKEARRRCERYDLLVKAGTDVAGFALTPSKVVAVYSPLLLGDKACDPVGLDSPKEMLKEHLLDEHKKLKVVSILGTGGLGKTTLAKELHGELQAEFSCRALVYFGRNPSVWRILVNILYQTMSSSNRKVYFKAPPKDNYFLPLCEREQQVILEKHLDEQQVIALLWGHLSQMRYFIVLDGVWSIRYWRVISGALPDNNLGSRILITTRIADVADSCSPGPTDMVHHMKALSEGESNRLFFAEEENPADNEILKICGGIPLAITLAARARQCEELVEPKTLGKSIFYSLIQYPTSEGMTKILLMIYADLSLHVRSCFLYLSVFLEDYIIKKNRLILLWGAEGFIPEETRSNDGRRDEECSWVTGERYFNELISRGLIQPVFNFEDDQEVGCIVHTVVLDFIRSMSREENFATRATQLTSGPCPCDTIRRFSLDCSNEDEADTLSPSSVHLSSMRSLTVFGDLQGDSKGDEEIYDNTPPSVSRDDEGMFDALLVSGHDEGMFDPSFSEDDDHPVLRDSTINLPIFTHLRVLDLEDTKNLKNQHLEGIGGLVLLRYLGLGGTDIDELPEDIGELQQLETLVLRRKGLITFPASIVKLQKFRHLLLPVDAKQIWEMPELEVASTIRAENSSSLGKVVELLRKSERLRMLGVSLERSITKETDLVYFLEAVVKSKLQFLSLDFQCSVPLLVDSWEKVTAPLEKKFEPLRFELWITVFLCRVPPNMGSLASLTHLHIIIYEATAEDLLVLGGLLNLVLLNLTATDGHARVRFIIKKSMFPCVKVFSFKTGQRCMGLEFEGGAMPQLQRLGRGLGTSVQADIGIEHLTCLTRVHATINCLGATVSEVQAAEAAIIAQVSKIATKPTLELSRENEYWLWKDEQE